MSQSEDKPVVNIPSLEEMEKMVLKSLLEGDPDSFEEDGYTWEDFIEN